MTCEKDNGEITDYLSGQMTATEQSNFEKHLSQCAACREELVSQQQVWELLGTFKVPAPSSRLDNVDLIFPEPRHINRQSWLKVAAVLMLVIAGFAAGYFANRPAVTYSYKQQVDSLSAQVHDMREMVMLSLLENPSASERIRAVGFTSEISSVNPKIIEALLSTLNNDPNVNVRLMTLEALSHYGGNPAVREGLVQSIIQQQSPLIQSALADVMLKMQEKKSIESFKKLLDQKQVNLQVRTKIQEIISRLI